MTTHVNEYIEKESSQAVPEGNLLDQVGRTPVLPINQLASVSAEQVRVLAKAEWLNPTGSVKDRPAANILRQALASGQLDSGKALLDSTSGNMGIAYATFGSALGIDVHLAVPSNASQARLRTLRALGAKLTLTDPLEGSDGARVVAADMAEENPDRFYYADQYNNDANWKAHYRSTGPEIVRQTKGEITHFIAGLGTTGTLVGTGRYLREHAPAAEIVAVQPDSPLHGLEGLKHLPSAPIPEIYAESVVDRTIHVSTEAAYEMTRQLARKEGVLVGVSAGAAMWAARQVAAQLERGTVVVVFPDTGARYLGEPFWEAES
ncbi:MAG: PLP-dependent cysteine synthase family protein [Anaerolineales bacterium]|nr:PLP-dependent cysteine synthase family protein [Anaerolineales bacterium]